MRIALAGNPNSGKTTMYNALTGSNEKVGNWAGVTVEQKEHPIKRSFYQGEDSLVAVDLPGAYSMSPFTSEESVTSDYVKNENPDAIINIVDATNLSRSLFFTTQLLELGVPVVVALNKADINEKKKTVINVEELSLLLGCPVVETVSTATEGLVQLMAVVLERIGAEQKPPYTDGEIDLSNKKAVNKADRRRYAFVNGIVAKVERRKIRTSQHNVQDDVDAVVTNPFVGLLIFAAVMFLVFQISQAWLGPWLSDLLVGWIDAFKEWVDASLEGANAFLSALLVEGVIGGVSAVVSFLPLVMIMYFLIALLEDCGYMARATVVLDPIFKKVGLSGKSVIPFVVGTGCAIPGVMACRTIRNERERNATAMLTPFMPCGAKLPVIALFAGAFFPDAAWVGTLMYFVGILLIFIGALLINKITAYKAKKSFFIMEMPEYKFPSLKRASFSMLTRGWSYVVKAGTIILLCNAIVHVMQYFDWNLTAVADGAESTSILASIAGPISYALVPIVGVAAWQLAAAAITGFIAKENVVGTLAVCYGFMVNEDLEMASSGNEVAMAMRLTQVAALAYLMFNLFTPPCFAAIGAMRAEISSRKWFWSGVAMQMGVGYSVAFLVYQIGTLVTTGHVGPGFVPGLAVVLALVALVIFLCVRAGSKARAEGTKIEVRR